MNVVLQLDKPHIRVLLKSGAQITGTMYSEEEYLEEHNLQELSDGNILFRDGDRRIVVNCDAIEAYIQW